jgi:cytochrome P450
VAEVRQIDFFGPEYLANPYPIYAKLRSETPAARVTLPDGRVGWLFTRYEDVETILKDHKRFSNSSFIGQTEDHLGLPPKARGVMTLFNEILLGKDPPEHTRQKNLVHKAFTPRLVEGMRPNIQGIADDLLDTVEEQAQESGEKKMDLIADYAFPLPVRVILELLGIPLEDRDKIRRWSDVLATFDGSLETAEKMASEVDAFMDYITAISEAKRKNPDDDLLTGLVHAEEEGRGLSDKELLSMVFLLVFAGHHTTKNLIGNGTLVLLTHPDLFEKLKADPSLIKSAVEEFLRYEPPSLIPRTRIALEDVEVGGVTVRRGEPILPVIASANHDPDRFAAPDELDIARNDNRHLAFSTGIHFCLGAPLARLEGQIAFDTLLRRMPNLRLAVRPEELRYQSGGLFLRGLEALPVSF